MKNVIFIGGLYNMAFALFHSGFWKLWKWDSELNKLAFVNSGIMQCLNVQIIYYFIFTAVICFVFPTELRSTKLGRYFLIGTSAFWFIRTIQQFIFFNTNDAVLYVSAAVFLLGTGLFLIPVFYKKSK
ncbi:MAG: hypothetical protein LBU91_07445 [Bacteroidales bacterium]|nr:hypothetical protein [Bacteroidales bacterium]